MLITAEQQQALIDNFIKQGCNADQLDGFEQGMNAMLGLVAKLSKKKVVSKETKKGKSVTFDDAWYYIGIEDVEYKLLHSHEYHDALKIILTSSQYDEHNSVDTSRVFNVSDARISKFLDFYNGKENVWRRTNTSKQ